MVEVKNEIFPVLEQIEQTHKIPRSEIIKLIETAVSSAASKFFGSGYRVVTEMDIEDVEIKTDIIKRVVEKVTNQKEEISIEEAKKIVDGCKIGDEIKILVDNESFRRIAIQSAKKVILQKLRESYKKNIYDEYESKIGKIIPASVYAFRGKTIILDLGKVEGILPQREQVFKEKFKIGQHIKVLVKNVEQTKKGIRVITSRFDKNFIKKLFETEIPEIKDGTIEIIQIVRAAGYRSKIVLKSNNPKVNPIGSCVGIKGVRIKPIINELQGECIDLIPYTEDVTKFITYALSPWQPQKVEIVDEQKRIAKAYFPRNVYETAVKKNNINLNLAKELTGWEIEIEPVSETSQEKEK